MVEEGKALRGLMGDAFGNCGNAPVHVTRLIKVGTTSRTGYDLPSYFNSILLLVYSLYGTT
jgi:hypothetical protein